MKSTFAASSTKTQISSGAPLASSSMSMIISWLHLSMRTPHLKQMLKSWYAFFFQIPKLPERVVRKNNWRFLISAMPNTFTKEERNRYRDVWGQPDSITAMINWYRASLRGMGKSTEVSKIKAPTLVLWGKQDPHISYEMAALSVEMCEKGRLVTFEDATHWVLQDEPEATSKYITQHFLESNEDE